MWLGVDLKMNTNKDMCLEEIGPHAQDMLTILDSIADVIGDTYMTIS